jgi:hypothetical protein
VATVIRAAARACVKLRIVGGDPERESFCRLAGQTGEGVEFCRDQSGSALRAAFVSARTVVVPSEWYEIAPVSLVEASVLARAAIGACIGGIPELIREGETGFLFDRGRVDANAGLGRVQALSDSALALLPPWRCRAAQGTVAGARRDDRGPNCDCATILRDLCSIRLGRDRVFHNPRNEACSTTTARGDCGWRRTRRNAQTVMGSARIRGSLRRRDREAPQP